MTPENRNKIESLLRQVHEILCEEKLVRTSDWSFKGHFSDGRMITHKFKVGGYLREGPTAEKERIALGLPDYKIREAEILAELGLSPQIDAEGAQP